MTVEAVLFDAGETLLHPHPSFPELFTAILRGEGFDVDQERLRERLHLVAELFTRAAAEGEVWSASPDRSRSFWGRVYGTLLESLGIPPSDRLATRLYAEFTTLANYRLFPDVLPTLERLRAGGLAMGVVSNFEEWLERLLESLGVTAFFEVRVISGVEGIEKPDPRIFRLALERMGVAPEHAAYVGDSPEFDVRPAQSVGMLAVLLDRRGRHPDHPGPRVETLADVPGLLRAAA